MLKKVFTFIFIILPWYISYILPLDYKYFDEIRKPFFAPPQWYYIISWNIIYILIAITIYKIATSYKLNEIPKSYKITLLINYLFNQSYPIVFFGLKSPFLGLVSSLAILITTLLLYEETSLLKTKCKYLLIPYILQGILASILSISIYIMN